jgi:hypothetical protein
MPPLNHTITQVIDNFAFGDLSREVLIDLFKDGRVSSYFLERLIAKHDGLTHVGGCRDHDMTDEADTAIKYDEKTFTKNGCKFMPSNMIGTGRQFDQAAFLEKANKLIYVVASVVNFPEIKIRYVRGDELALKYPKGEIPFSKHDEFFNGLQHTQSPG